MKKLFALFLVLSLLTPFCITGFAQDSEEYCDDIQSFIDDSLELISKAPEIKDVPMANNSGIQNEENIDTYGNFETCRLIVESEEKPDKLNSLGIASGFMDYHIVQFKNTYDTENAFKYYSAQEDVASVYTDEFVNPAETETSETTSTEKRVVPTRLNSWGAASIGLYDLTDYLVNNNIRMEEVVVGVVDSGINLRHEFFVGRLIETGFNASKSGTANSEMDRVCGHGTNVASVIIDSTPSNIKVASYRIGEDDGKAPLSAILLGTLQAIEDNVDVINISYTGVNKREFISNALKIAYDKNIVVVTAAGNESDYDAVSIAYPSKSDYAINVAAVTATYMPCSFTDFGELIYISAPGKSIYVADAEKNYSYTYVKGTSFSSPHVAAACAIYKALNPDGTVEEIKSIICETASSHNEYLKTYDGINQLLGPGVIDAIGVSGLDRQNDIKANIKPGDYQDTVSIELLSEGADEIYYTLDETVPKKESQYLYTGPIEISGEGIVIKAVAYKEGKLRSRIFSGYYNSWIEDDEQNFTTDENGKILSYSGNYSFVQIPETVNGIKVTDIKNNAFDNTQVKGVTLPKTITVLTGGFCENTKIKYVRGESVKEIGSDVFRESAVSYVKFPNVEKIGKSAFSGTLNLMGVSFPELKAADEKAFQNNKMIYMYLPKLEAAGQQCFYYCHNLIEFYAPELKALNNVTTQSGTKWFQYSVMYKPLDLPSAETIYEHDFDYLNECKIKRIEFSNLKELIGLSLSDRSNIINYTMVLPATVETITCKPLKNDEHYNIYGTKGTYVEQWAKEQGDNVNFIELTSETAVIKDLPEYYKAYMGELEPDIIGFNRTYQWYANTVDSNEGGTLIEGATNKKFNPADYPAPYYYCEVTSTDHGYEPMIIKTSACENKSLKPDAQTLVKLFDTDGNVVRKEYISDELTEYTLKNIADGIYTVNISRDTYVSREYIVDISGNEAKIEFTLNRIGDINSDGKVTVADYTQLLKHVKKISLLDGYEFECADVNKDGRLTVLDYNKMLRHVKKTEMLW